MISFNAIPINFRTPGHHIEFDPSRALQGLSGSQHRILVLGQKLPTGSAASNVATRVLSAAQAEENFGRGSMLASMLVALKAANSSTDVWAVALAEGAGAYATGTVTLGGAPTESGTLNLYIGGQQVRVAVTSGEATAAIATRLDAAINAALALNTWSTLVGSVLTITAKNRGEAGNSIDLRVNYYSGERTPKGMTVTIVAMSGGTANPDIQPAITAIGDEQYHTVVCPYTDAANLAKLEQLMAQRFGPMVQKEGHAFVAASGSHATLSTLGNSRNSPHLTIMGAGKSPTPPYVWAAVVGAVDAAEPDPARPRQTLLLPGLLPPAIADRLTRDERNLHLFDGVSTAVVDAGGQVLIERLITAYQVNAYGVDDPAYLNVETMRILAYLRQDVRALFALKYPRHKLAKDGTRFGPGQAVMTPNLARAELVARFALWEEAGLVEDIEQFKRDLIVERNETDTDRLDAVIPPNVINQFRVFAAQIQFRL